MEESGATRWTEVESAFLALLAIPTSARAQALQERCGHDPELLASVQKLLDNDSTAFIQPLILEPAETDGWIGREVGSYRITALIGRGGMGAVYLAERDDVFQKQVAIKLIRFDTGDDGPRRRFRRERQILALLEHPNIARLLDGGNTEGGTHARGGGAGPGQHQPGAAPAGDRDLNEGHRPGRNAAGHRPAQHSAIGRAARHLRQSGVEEALAAYQEEFARSTR